MTRSVSDIRRRSLIAFNEAYIHNLDKASYIINSYYRLCGLSDTLLYRDNDAYLHDKPYTARLHDKEDRWVIRLNKALKPYGLTLMYFSWLPSICIKDESKKGNCGNRVYEPTFYN